MDKKGTHRESSNKPPKSLALLMKNSIWVYKTLFSLSKVDLILVVITELTIAIFPTISAFYAAKIIDEVIRVSSDAQRMSDLTLQSPLIGLLLITVSLTTFNRIANHLNRHLYRRFDRLHLRLFQVNQSRKISQLDVQQFEDSNIANSIRKAKDNFYKIQMFFQSSLSTFASLISTIIAGLISFGISPVLTLIIIVLSLPNNLVYGRFVKKIWEHFNSTVELNRKGWHLLWDLEHETHIPEHKISGSDRWIGSKALSIFMKQAGNEIAIHRDRIRGTIAGTLLNSVTYLLTPIFLISKVIAEEISVGQFTFFQSKMLDFSRDLDYTIGQVIDVTDAAVYVTYVKDLQELAPVIKSGNQHLISSRNNPPHIELKNVSFKYPNTKKFALKDISLTITPGEEIALVGENGAGKTTLIKLLLRFYDPTSGQILIDGIPLPKLSLEEYYDRIGALFQEYNRYESLTVKQNITLGDSRKQAHAKRITSAARQADAHSFITRLEKGYQQILNKSFTNGTRLSTGQWQKLSIARMFFRDSPILILDEPTASIDAEAEYKIFKRIYRFIQNKTVVIISHRFSTVRNASKIYVIQHGRITESGTHEELIRNEGQYAHAFKLQAEGYQTKEPVLEKAA